jgi:hypothetical protein
MHAIDAGYEEEQARPPCATPHAPQPEHHSALVLLEDPNRQCKDHEHYEQQRDYHIDDHVVSFVRRKG